MDNNFTDFCALVALSAIAKKIKIPTDKARYWFSLLKVEPTKQGNFRYVQNDQATLLERMATLVETGLTPREAARKVRESPTDIQPVQYHAIQPEVPARLKSMEQAILALVEKISGMGEEIKALRMENSSLKGLLLPPVRSAPTISAPVEKNIPIQREVSAWESLKTSFDDVWGFAFGGG